MRENNRSGVYKAPDDIFDLNDLDELQDFESYEEYAAYMRGLEEGRREGTEQSAEQWDDAAPVPDMDPSYVPESDEDAYAYAPGPGVTEYDAGEAWEPARKKVFHQEPGQTGHLYDVSDSEWNWQQERAEERARAAKAGKTGRTGKAQGRKPAGDPSRNHADSRGRKKGKDTEKERKHFPYGLVILLLLFALIGASLYYVYMLFSGIQTVTAPGAFSAQLREDVNDKVQTDPFMTGYTNIALFGVDSRDSELLSGNNRSDIIMILSINNLDGKCRLLSLYRDTYLNVGGDVYTKCNAAYAYGGPEQAVRMLNENLDLNITDFVTIGFGGLADLIDAVGGVDIEVAEDEVHGINDYESTMAQELGREYVPVQGPGYQTLTGLQAVAYCRIRYTAGDDFRRTQRQREVLMQTFRKAKNVSPDMINAITNKVFNEVATSITAAEAVPLALQLLRTDIADTGGFPTESLRTTGVVNSQDCIIPVTLEDNVKWLHGYLFEDTAYEVSDRVRAISDQIRSNTGR